MENINKHQVILVLHGDIAYVRARLINALEQFNYCILGEQPIHVRRDARSAGYIWSGNVLDFPTTLLVNLKSAGERATRVTLHYSIEDKMFFNGGDRQTLSREAEAIAALAMTEESSANCLSCGAEGASKSRFCRQCGAPVSKDSPAELEVLRVTAALSAVREDIFSGVIILAIMCLILIPVLLFMGPKVALVVSLIVGGLFGSIGLTGLLFGIRRLHRTLNPKNEKEALPAGRQPEIIVARTAALAPPPEPASITESTTNLLSAKLENSPGPSEQGVGE